MATPRQSGWYDDPNDSNAQRYWDGQDWTPHRQRKPLSRQRQAPVSPTPPQPAPSNLPPRPNLPPPSPRPPNAQSPTPPDQPSGGGPPQRSRSPKRIMAVIAAVAVLAVAAVLVYTFVLPAKSSNRDSPQAACDAMKDQSNTSAISWYQARKAAGDSYRQILSILTYANDKCPTTIGPQMMGGLARQMESDSVNDLRAYYRNGGH